MIGYLFIFLHAFFSACADAFENENFFESIFKRFNQRFWYKRESWRYTKKFFGYRFDAWHISKSLMVICLLATLPIDIPGSWYVILINGAALWNFTFWLFYHKIFKIK